MLESSREVKSFSAVATAPCHKEAALMVYSIRQFYQCPILIITDEETQAYLRQFNFEDVVCRPEATKDHLADAEKAISHVKKQNTFHNRGAIYKKMDAIDWGVSDCGNTMFLDADITLVRSIHRSITHPVMLSPHHHTPNRQKENHKYGGFNAGYVFTSEPSLADYWREIYLHRSSFYEQQGMALLFEDFDVGKFDKFHNIGFWRNTDPQIPELPFSFGLTRSLHCHFDKAAYRNADDGLKTAYDKWNLFWRRQLPPKLNSFIKDVGM